MCNHFGPIHAQAQWMPSLASSSSAGCAVSEGAPALTSTLAAATDERKKRRKSSHGTEGLDVTDADTKDFEAGSTAGSSSVGSISNYEKNMMEMMASMASMQIGLDTNMAGIQGVNASVSVMKPI